MTTDCKTHKVVVKGKSAAADPLKVVDRVEKKSGRKVELLSPIPPKPEEKKEEKKEEEKPKQEEKKEEVFLYPLHLSLSKTDDTDERFTTEQPKVIAVVLKVHMHCEACLQEIKKRILRMKGLASSFLFDSANLSSSRKTINRFPLFKRQLLSLSL